MFEWDILLFATSLKLLLYPAYHSTDFEVHRNWLAITYSLPLSKWYFDSTSQWTLDYPPFFAYFERILSIPASFIDQRIVDLQSLEFNNWGVVVYQRTTVILAELFLGTALVRFTHGSVDTATQRIISTSLFLHPGFLIVDHIHFQYNSFMFGILLWSILMIRNGYKLSGGILFAVLLNFKHIYMYIAPAYFIYLLRAYCMSPSKNFRVKPFLILTNAVIVVFVISFAPFIIMGQIPQIMSRLFPFTRGLNHAYWAPNVWALVTSVDRILLKYVQHTGANIAIDPAGIYSTSRGRVEETVFAVLPTVKPIHTFIITLTFQLICLVKLWRTPTYKSFVTAVTLCGYSAFLFGWHVHEKAVLLVLVPLSLLATERHIYYRTYLLASISGVFSLFPLLFTPYESVVEVFYSFLWIFFVHKSLSRRLYEFPTSFAWVLLDWLETAYLAGFPFLLFFQTLFTRFIPRSLSKRCSPENTACPETGMEFLPLLMTSVYCAIGLTWGFIRLMYIYLFDEEHIKVT